MGVFCASSSCGFALAVSGWDGHGPRAVLGSEQLGHTGLVQQNVCQVRSEADQLPSGFA